MIRIVIENLFFFFLPTIVYVAWIAFKRHEWPGLVSVLRDAPLVRLFILGAMLMVATLAVFSTRTTNSPDTVYVPPSSVGGKIAPGRPAAPPVPTEAPTATPTPTLTPNVPSATPPPSP